MFTESLGTNAATDCFPKIALARRILVGMRPACAFNTAGLCAASNIMMASSSRTSASSRFSLRHCDSSQSVQPARL
jgi:bifunctional pyridoxal-dependent enzyme with beta-cystathionase and maltose regulon repressor activities